jgi:hypothetical protein
LRTILDQTILQANIWYDPLSRYAILSILKLHE